MVKTLLIINRLFHISEVYCTTTTIKGEGEYAFIHQKKVWRLWRPDFTRLNQLSLSFLVLEEVSSHSSFFEFFLSSFLSFKKIILAANLAKGDKSMKIFFFTFYSFFFVSLPQWSAKLPNLKKKKKGTRIFLCVCVLNADFVGVFLCFIDLEKQEALECYLFLRYYFQQQ